MFVNELLGSKTPDLVSYIHHPISGGSSSGGSSGGSGASVAVSLAEWICKICVELAPLSRLGSSSMESVSAALI